MNIVNIIHITDDVRNVKDLPDDQRNELHKMVFKQSEIPHEILGYIKRLEFIHVKDEIQRADELPEEQWNKLRLAMEVQFMETIRYKMNQASL